MGLIITGRNDVLKTVADRAGTETPVVAVLSINMPSGRNPAPQVEGVAQKFLSFWDSEQPVRNGPDMQQVQDGIQFIVEHAVRGDVLVHCQSGKARSVGIAMGALALLHPDDTAEEIIKRILDIRPQAAPNIIVVEMADKITGRGGRLLQAVLDHPGLTEARRTTEENRRRMLENNPQLAYEVFPEKFPNGPPPAKNAKPGQNGAAPINPSGA